MNHKLISIFHVISSTKIGGAEMMLQRFLSHHSSSDCSIVISLTPLGRMAELLSGQNILVVSLNITSWRNVIGGLVKYIKLVLEHRPKYIISWMYHSNLLVILFQAIARNTRIVWNIRCGLSDYKYWSMRRKILLYICRGFASKYQKIVYNSERSLRQHVDFGFHKTDSLVVYNGFDETKFLGNKHEELRDMFGVPNDAQLIGCFGRNVKVKRASDLLDVAKKLNDLGDCVHILYVGRGYDTVEFQKKVNDYGLEKYVHIVPETLSLLHFYKGIDIFCLCSESEGFPNVVGEAVYCDVPIFVTDVSDLKSKFLQNWQISAVGDIDGLAASAHKIYTMTSEEKKSLLIAQKNAFRRKTEITAVTSQLAHIFFE